MTGELSNQAVAKTYAQWARFAPIYDKASDEHGEITFAKLDTDANQALSGQLGIEGIPTLMAFR